jgi:3-hydroxyisobutyrate dehydrogenase-like beta-hydroxyacid dehydrogenase
MELTMQTLSAGKVKLGFIGLGAMGSRLALRLLSQGYEMAVYNRDRKKAVALSPHGVSVAESPAELAGKADVILSCLSNDQAVLEIYTAPEGALAGARRGAVVLELSTVSPQTSRELHRLGADRGVEVLDAAISGSTLAVEHGTVVLLIGGNAEPFQAAEPIFRALAARFFLMGPTGSGTAMKLVNTLLGVGMQAIAEAVVLGEAESLDRHRLLEVLSQTAVVAPAHVGKLAAAERNDYAAQFAVGLMNKDFQLILKAANAQKIAMPATEAAFAVNSSAMASCPGADFSSVIRRMESLAKLNVSK